VFDGEEEVAEHLYISAVLSEMPKKRGADARARAITEIDAGDIRAFDSRELAPGALLSKRIRSSCIILVCAL